MHSNSVGRCTLAAGSAEHLTEHVVAHTPPATIPLTNPVTCWGTVPHYEYWCAPLHLLASNCTMVWPMTNTSTAAVLLLHSASVFIALHNCATKETSTLAHMQPAAVLHGSLVSFLLTRVSSQQLESHSSATARHQPAKNVTNKLDALCASHATLTSKPWNAAAFYKFQFADNWNLF